MPCLSFSVSSGPTSASVLHVLDMYLSIINPNLALQPCRTPPPLPPSSTVVLSPTLSPFLQSSAVSPFFTCRTPPPTNRFCAQSMDLPFGTCAKAHCCAACVGSSSSPSALARLHPPPALARLHPLANRVLQHASAPPAFGTCAIGSL